MNALLNATAQVNGSKPPVNGRGLTRRRLSLDEQAKLAADLATGERPFLPSLAQACMLVDVPQKAVVAELRARAARRNGKPSKDLAASIVEAWDAAAEHEYEREVAVRTIGVAAVWNVISRIVA
jgi:hypothetical protein